MEPFLCRFFEPRPLGERSSATGTSTFTRARESPDTDSDTQTQVAPPRDLARCNIRLAGTSTFTETREQTDSDKPRYFSLGTQTFTKVHGESSDSDANAGDVELWSRALL